MRVVPYGRVSDLDALLREHLGEETRNWKETCCVVPSRRDREWWSSRAGLDEFGLEPAARVRLWNWEDLYNDLCAFFAVRRLRQIDPPDHRLILSHVVAGFLREQRGRKPGVLELWPGLSRPGFIDVLTPDIRELINEAVSAEHLAVTEREDRPTSGVLPELYRRYLAYLGENGLMDSAQIPLLASGLLEKGKAWAGEKRFAFVGFMSFTHGQLGLVRKLEELAEVTVFKPATGLAGFQDATRQLYGLTWEEEPAVRGTLVSMTASEFSLEPEMIARQLALWRAGEGFLSDLPFSPSCFSPSSPSSGGSAEGEREEKGKFPFPGFEAIGLTTPPQRVPAVEAALRRYRVPCERARGRSVSQTLAGSAVGSIWTAWTRGFEPFETALLLSQPWAGGLSVDDAVRSGPRGAAEWEAYLEEKARTSKNVLLSKTFLPLKAFRAVVKFCRAIEKGASPAGLLKAFHDFLTVPGLWVSALADLAERSPELDESLRELAASIEEAERKHRALLELQPDIGPAGKIVLEGREALGFLTDWCEETLVRPAPPLSGAVVLYAGPPPILASHPVWIMTDATHKNWPGLIHASPLLDTPEREAMRAVSAYLPSIHDKREQKEALFRRLLQTGDVLTLTTCAATDEEGRPVGPSSFTKSFLVDMKYWEHEEIPISSASALMPGGDAGACFFPEIEAPASERAGRVMPVARGRQTEKPSLPVSALFELLDCPFRWWMNREVRLKERDRALFSEAEAGNLTHRVWENVWRRLEREEREGQETSLSRLAADEWREAVKAEGDYAPFARLLRDPRLKRRLAEAEFYVLRLAGTQDGIRERLAGAGMRRAALFLETDLPPYELDGVVFTGRCDRVEIFEDGAVITDYKWGRSSSYEKRFSRLTERRNLSDFRALLAPGRDFFRYGLQLSAYALMYGEGTGTPVAGVGFLGHKDGGFAGTFAPSFFERLWPERETAFSAALTERKEEAAEAMRCAAALLKAGRYEPCYVADACRYCGIKGVCRKGELRGEFLSMDGDAEGEEDELQRNAD